MEQWPRLIVIQLSFMSARLSASTGDRKRLGWPKEGLRLEARSELEAEIEAEIEETGNRKQRDTPQVQKPDLYEGLGENGHLFYRARKVFKREIDGRYLWEDIGASCDHDKTGGQAPPCPRLYRVCPVPLSCVFGHSP